MEFSLSIPVFFAGVLTFLAPCTLPLVPGYLGFISGVSTENPQNSGISKSDKRKIFLNGILFVAGFSAVFILLGTAVGFGGQALFQYRAWLSRIGGIFVILFGLSMLNVLRMSFLSKRMQIKIPVLFQRGRAANSFIFGAAFGLGWTPCVGPALGSVLALAAVSATAARGAFLLSVYSLGLAIPFLIIAAGIGSASAYIARFGKYSNAISAIGGIFIVFLGILMLTNKIGLWTAFFYQIFYFFNYGRLLDYL